MPAIDDSRVQIELDRATFKPEREAETSGFGETFVSAFRQDTMLGAYIIQEPDLPDNVINNVNFNPVDHFTEYEKLDDTFIQRAALADTPHELNAVRRQYQKELADRKVLENSGAMGVIAQIGAQVLDPINFIPVGGASYKTYKAGHNILKGAAVSGSVASGVTAAQEAALHNIQITRTLGESATNVAGAAVLGGVIGGAAGGISTALMRAGRNLRDADADITQSMDVEPKRARGEPTVGTSEIVFNRIDVIHSSDLKIADQIEADSLDGYKRSLERDLERKLPRGERKRLDNELKDLKAAQAAVKPQVADVPAQPGLSARRAKQQAIKEAEQRASAERERIQERINEVEAVLADSKIGETAQSNLSRLEQGIVPDEIRTKIDMRKAQAAKVEEVITSEEFMKIRDEVDAEVADNGAPKITMEDEKLVEKALGEDSASAMSAIKAPELRGKLTKAILRKLAFDPLSRTALSKNPFTRMYSADLAEAPLAFDGDYVPNALETRIKTRADGLASETLEFAEEQFKAYRNSRPDNPMKRLEFYQEIAKAFRRGDEHPNPFVKASAQKYRSTMYEPLKADAQNVMGPDNRPLLPEDVDTKTALSYLNRKFRGDLIIQNLPKWKRNVGQWLKLQDRLLRAENGTLDEMGTDADYEKLAGEIATRISSEPNGVLPYDYTIGENSGKSKSAPVRGPLQKRRFVIPDEAVEEFLENDMRILAENYSNNMVAQIEFADRFGSMDMTSQLKDVQDWWDGEISKAPAKQRERMAKKRDQDIKDLQGMGQRVSYQFKAVEDPNAPFSRLGRAALNLNYLRLGGGFVAASFSDVARIVAAEGMFNLVRFGLPGMIKRTKGFKMATKEARAYGVGIDHLKGSKRAALMADINNATRGNTKAERALQWGADNFGRVNLMDYWTTGMKQLHVATFQNRIIRELSKGKYDKNLQHLGIDEANAKAIAKQLERYGGDVDKMKIANTKDWDNPALAQLWGEALRKESDRVILIPGQEKPLMMSKQSFQVFLQFKSFMYSATQRILLSGIQGRDAHALQGAIAMMSMGMMSYAFKEWDAGRELSDDPRVWVDEGIDRSGMLGILGEFENTFEKISGSGIRTLIGGEGRSSRYASRTAVEAAMGPTYGSLVNTFVGVAAGGLNDGEWDDKDTRAFRRLMPYQNLSLLRRGFDTVEEETHNLIFE